MSQTSSTSVQRSAGNGSPGAIKLSARGLTNQKLVVKESRRAQRKATVNFLIDSGAVYRLVPSPTLKNSVCARIARWISHWPTGGPFGAGLAMLISYYLSKAGLH